MASYYGHNILANDEKYLLAKRKSQMLRIFVRFQTYCKE